MELMHYKFILNLQKPVRNGDKDVEQLQVSFIPGGNIKWDNHLGKLAICYKAKHTLSLYILTIRNILL